MYIANWGCIPIRYICAFNLLCRKLKGQHILSPTCHILTVKVTVLLIKNNDIFIFGFIHPRRGYRFHDTSCNTPVSSYEA